MPIQDTIKKRSTIRNFTGNIPTAELADLLQLASYAPNHGLREPWRFITINSYESWIKLYQLTPTRHPFMKVFENQLHSTQTFPTGIIVIARKGDDAKIAREDLLGTAALIQNFQLLAWDKGYGVVWRTLCIDTAFEQTVGIQEDETVVGFLQAGTFDSSRSPIGKYRQDIRKKMSEI